MHISRFEKLPQEVRDHIYRHIFPCDEILLPGVHYTCGPVEKPFPSLAILQVSRRIATEAALVLFEQNSCQLRMPPIHLCTLGRCTNKNGCTEMRSGEPVKEDNHNCTELGCVPGHKQRHLAQRLMQRYGHQIQHVHLAVNSIDMLHSVGRTWIDELSANVLACALQDDHTSCESFRTCGRSYIGWTWECHALRSIASTGLKSMTLDLGDLCWDVYILDCEEVQRARKKEFVRLVQDLFHGLKVRQVTFRQFQMELDAVTVWLNPELDTGNGSGWINSLTVIGLPWQEDTDIFLTELKQAGQRAAIAPTVAASHSENLVLSNVKDYDEVNTWLK